jgi:hypothetical protein
MFFITLDRESARNTGHSRTLQAVTGRSRQYPSSGCSPPEEGIAEPSPIHLLVEVEIEVVEPNLRITKLRLFPAPFQQSVATTNHFIGYQTVSTGSRPDPQWTGETPIRPSMAKQSAANASSSLAKRDEKAVRGFLGVF